MAYKKIAFVLRIVFIVSHYYNLYKYSYLAYEQII